ncbi:MAG: HU family DNA-binding protein [Chitinophagaceae bacterium]
MLKSDIVKEITHQTGITKADVLLVMETFFQKIHEHLEKGDTIYLKGFGKFSIKTRAMKIGRNIRKNIPIQIPEKKIIHFKSSQNITN